MRQFEINSTAQKVGIAGDTVSISAMGPFQYGYGATAPSTWMTSTTGERTGPFVSDSSSAYPLWVKTIGADPIKVSLDVRHPVNKSNLVYDMEAFSDELTIAGKLNGLQSTAAEIDGVVNVNDLKLVKIQKLFREACSGKKNDVKYIVVGDSTRDTWYNEMQAYYAKQLTKIGVLHYDNSDAGQSGHDWAYNVDQSTLAQCISACTGIDGENTIIEFSHGINDYSLNPVKATIKADLLYGISQLKIAKPKINILLVSPVTTGNTTRNPMLLEIYNELSVELNLPLVDVTTMTAPIQSDVNFYQDTTHPNKFGSRRIVDYIFSKIIPTELLSIMTIEPYYNGVQPPSTILSTSVEANYWNTGNGVSVTNATWRRFPEIPVEPNFTLMVKHGGNRHDIIFMDQNKNWISTVSITPVNGYRTRVIPPNAFFVRLNISNDGAAYDALNDVREVKYYDPSQGLYLTIEDIHAGLNIRNVINRFKNGKLIDDYGMIGSSGQNLTVDANGKMKWA